ncbi:uncharacterized protein LOC117150417 [Drosophila mauritiana]|uniref:Uncharacterized protein LOC117150417 n=1 Tax=Drosophila mauritiana TaxID=7226 RepID=A0A6P8L5E2_DROMA|nr:uncharacterized protein LOC117150417 [Drosophila mauritiana]
MNWFNNICEESRLKFFPNLQTVKTKRKYEIGLMSVDECYSFIRKNLKSRNVVEEELLWKIPILLVCLGCIIVILFAVCFTVQCLITKVKTAEVPKSFDFDICEVEKPKAQPIHKASQIDQPEKATNCCTCLKSNVL